jgi:hypothetical protein
MSKTEVFRLTPEPGKAYCHAECTEKVYDVNDWQNTKYFTTNPLTFVGVFVRHESMGYRDNATHWDIFDNNGTQVIVHYSYDGNTCFVEAESAESIEHAETTKSIERAESAE